jgi:hypothetical protein
LFPLFANNINLLLVSLLPVATTQALPMTKFTTGVVDNSGAPCFANISKNFEKNFNDPVGSPDHVIKLL